MRPDVSTASADPVGYVHALSLASEAGELVASRVLETCCGSCAATRERLTWMGRVGQMSSNLDKMSGGDWYITDESVLDLQRERQALMERYNATSIADPISAASCS